MYNSPGSSENDQYSSAKSYQYAFGAFGNETFQSQNNSQCLATWLVCYWDSVCGRHTSNVLSTESSRMAAAGIASYLLRLSVRSCMPPNKGFARFALAIC